jgi:hypothetical protein
VLKRNLILQRKNIENEMDTDAQKIDQIITGLEIYDFGDIIKSRKENMMIASFILCTCFIDHLSQHRYYKERFKEEKFVRFVKNYFDAKYDAEELYRDLRSKLVHNYSVNGKYLLTDGNPEDHLKMENGKTYINIDRFIIDSKIALQQYIYELRTDESIRTIALNHYKKYRILSQKS